MIIQLTNVDKQRPVWINVYAIAHYELGPGRSPTSVKLINNDALNVEEYPDAITDMIRRAIS